MRRSRKRMLAAVIAVLIVAGGAALAWRDRGGEQAAKPAGAAGPAAQSAGASPSATVASAAQASPAPAPPASSPAAQPSEAPALTPSVETDIPSVAAAYAAYFPIGAAVEPGQLTGLTAELLKKQVNALVAENAMKPDAIQPSEGAFTWERADRIVKFAQDNGMAVRYHTLVWHNQTPGWFFLAADGSPMVDETDPAKREANKKLLLKRLAAHVRAVVGRYKDEIKSWDVVNEVVEPGDPDGMRASEWYRITGTDYIETAFRVAREAGGGDIKLYINDYGTDDARKRDRLFELVKQLLDKGVPIDGVGHQTHINLRTPSVDAMLASFNKFKALGLDNIITELDMSLYTWDDRSDYGREVPADVLARQADRYRDIFDMLKANKGLVSAVTFWGIADNHTWLSSFPIVRTEAPFLFDQNYHAKPAFWAVVDPSKLPH
ncbi:endo-1,4-beta-xylanase [Cohnella sp. 56]|uniref:endo-1,4-beta-xylanase n=1 Tax=Cohnella sp. 56 TaxID=3113722 RepID=UPI0030E972D1